MSIQSVNNGMRPLEEGQFLQLLRREGNSEAKLTVQALFGLNPGKDFTVYSVNNELEAMEPEWAPTPGTIKQYCQLSLEPAGLLTTRGSAWQVTDFGANEGLHLAGAVGEWSLKYPDYSVQDLLAVNTPRGEHGGATATRHKLLGCLAVANTPVSESDIVNALGGQFADWQIWKHVAALKQKGLLDFSSSYQHYNPEYELREPKVRAPSLVGPTTRLIYDVLTKLYDSGVRSVSFEALLQDCIDSADGKVDPVKIRQKLAIAHQPIVLPCIVAKEPNDLGGTATKIALKPEARQPVEDLLRVLEEFRRDPRNKTYGEVAEDIFTDPSCVAELLDKCAQYSTKIRNKNAAERAAVEGQLLSIVTELGEPSLRDIYESMADQGSGLSRQAIGRRMKKLAARKMIDMTVVATDPTKIGKATIFTSHQS